MSDALKPVFGDEISGLEAKLTAVLIQGAAHTETAAEYERLAAQQKQFHRECYAEAMAIREQIKRAKHQAEGKCAAMISSGDRWYRNLTPCKNKAKPNSQFCGVHKHG